MSCLENQRFTKPERISSKKIIGTLFNAGQSFFAYPFKVHFLKSAEDGESSAEVLITVPKKNFLRATDRNLLKRRFREVYRKNKYRLTEHTQNIKYQIAFVYSAKEILPYSEIEKKLSLILIRLKEIKL